MKKIFLISFLILATFAISVQAKAEGQLFISPQRLDLTDKSAIGQLHLVNKSDSPKQYEIKLVNYAMNESGNLEKVENMEYSAADFIRYSPRRVTLESGEDQYVRVMARVPRKLEDGGYHTHVEFEEVDGAFNRSDKKDLGKNNTSFEIASTYSVAIPVFVQNGETEGTADLISATVEAKKGAKNGTALVKMKRVGNNTSYNLVKIDYVDRNGNRHIAATPAKIPVYREVSDVTRKFAMNLPEGVSFNGGEVQISLYPIDAKGEDKPIDAITANIN